MLRPTLLCLLLALAPSVGVGQSAAGAEGGSQLEEAQDLYERGLRRMRRGYYEDAVVLFDKVRNRYPLSRVAPLAQLRVADCLFENADYLGAVDGYSAFIQLHPMHEEVPYAMYRIGDTYMKMAPKLPSLDHTDTERGIKALEDYERRFTESPYTTEARDLIEQAEERLARKEIQIGNYYFRMREKEAACVRYERAFRFYPSVDHPSMIRPLVRLAVCERAEGDDEAADALRQRLATQFPESRRKQAAVADLEQLLESGEGESVSELKDSN